MNKYSLVITTDNHSRFKMLTCDEICAEADELQIVVNPFFKAYLLNAQLKYPFTAHKLLKEKRARVAELIKMCQWKDEYTQVLFMLSNVDTDVAFAIDWIEKSAPSTRRKIVR